MTNIVSFSKRQADIAAAKIDRKATSALRQAIYDKRLSRGDLEVLARILTERPKDGSLSAYLTNKAVAKSCAKIVALGLLDSDGPYECIAPNGVSAGWFQSFQFANEHRAWADMRAEIDNLLNKDE